MEVLILGDLIINMYVFNCFVIIIVIKDFNHLNTLPVLL